MLISAHLILVWTLGAVTFAVLQREMGGPEIETAEIIPQSDTVREIEL